MNLKENNEPIINKIYDFEESKHSYCSKDIILQIRESLSNPPMVGGNGGGSPGRGKEEEEEEDAATE